MLIFFFLNVYVTFNIERLIIIKISYDFHTSEISLSKLLYYKTLEKYYV